MPRKPKAGTDVQRASTFKSISKLTRSGIMWTCRGALFAMLAGGGGAYFFGNADDDSKRNLEDDCPTLFADTKNGCPPGKPEGSGPSLVGHYYIGATEWCYENIPLCERVDRDLSKGANEAMRAIGE